MTHITIVDDVVRRVDATPDPGRETFLVDADRLPEALGWELKPSGLCREGTCVPVADVDALKVGGQLDLTAVAGALGRAMVVDVDAGLAAISLPAELRRRALVDLRAPAFELPDVEETLHRLDDWLGLKKLLVAFSSWCGCRYDLPGWQALHDELGPDGFTVIAVAIDHSAADVRPWIDGITMPVLYDPQHLITELYAISNVPTVVWIDEENRIARPNGSAFGTDVFAEFTGVESGPHLDDVRRWVHDGTVPVTEDEARQAVGDLSPDEVLARLHFRVAAEAHRQGDQRATRLHVTRASELAPDDLTVWRAGMPLVGEDPFGDDFLTRFEEWRGRGMPYHGLPAVKRAEPAGR
ncbi:MAG: TlpA disulfide reductase family protein [Acidimicrobiales bacterium]|jgi:peroxiredoxin